MILFSLYSLIKNKKFLNKMNNKITLKVETLKRRL